jgi:hypothetical protein
VALDCARLLCLLLQVVLQLQQLQLCSLCPHLRCIPLLQRLPQLLLQLSALLVQLLQLQLSCLCP